MLLKCISINILQVGEEEITASDSGNRENISANLMINST